MNKILKKQYWKLISLIHQIIGSSIEERYFRSRESTDVIKGFSNITLPHREWLARRILDGQKKYLEILEVGCGWGPNLAVLSKLDPNSKLMGIDISPASIKEGCKRLNELGFKNITLREMAADDLKKMPTSSVDVVFTDAVLLYIGPDKIYRIIEEMCRIARNKVIFLEMHETQGVNSKDIYTKDGWVRDYVELLSSVVEENEIQIVKLPSGLRPSGRWPIYGHMVEIVMKKTSS